MRFVGVIASGFDGDAVPDTWLLWIGASEDLTEDTGEVISETGKDSDMS